MASRPPLGLHTEIETFAGDTYRWDGNARDPGNRPQAITCGSKIGEGYGQSSVTLARKGTRTYPDIDEFSTLRHIGVDGQTAYEGRIAATPRSNRKIEVQAVGWISHARDTPIPALLIIDRDLSSWTSASRRREANVTAVNLTLAGPQTLPDSSGVAALELRHADEWAAPYKPLVEAWFDAGPIDHVGRIYFDIVNVGAASTANANWDLFGYLLTDDAATTVVSTTGDMWASVPLVGALDALTPTARFALINFAYTATPGGAPGNTLSVHVRHPVVYGFHGLTRQGTEPGGFLASDIIRYVSELYAPLLDASEIMATPTIIDQFRFKDRTDAYDVFLKANAYDRYNLGVWDNRVLTYAPMPAETDDPTWLVRSEDGTGIDANWTGPSTAASANGVLVRFQNVLTGQEDYVSPDTDASLADTRDTIAANRAGIKRWEAIQLPDPNSPTGAAEIGRAVLAEFNRPRQPGEVTIRGHIRDLSGAWHQGWRVRAGQTVLLEDDPDATPLTIWEPSWSQDSKTLTMHVDAPAATSDSILGDVLMLGQRRVA